MGEIRYIIKAKQCKVAGKLSILDGCLKKSFSSVYDLGKQFFGNPSGIDDFPCNLTQFCYIKYQVSLHQIINYLKDKIGVVFLRSCVIFDTL